MRRVRGGSTLGSLKSWRMRMRRGTWCWIGLAALAVLTSPAQANGQTWPVKPVRLVVPMPVGSGLDTIAARPLAQKLAEKWRQPVLVDNVPGAGGTVGA